MNSLIFLLLTAPLQIQEDAAYKERMFNRAAENEQWLFWVDKVPYLELPDHIGMRVEIAGPWFGKKHLHYELLIKPTRDEAYAALEKHKKTWEAAKVQAAKVEVRLRPSPFQGSSPAPRWPLPSAKHDRDLSAAGPWPDDLAFPSEMKRYARAAYTQEIAVTDNRDRISPVHRLNLESKWHQSGGMEGIDFRSDLYRYLPEEPQAWVDNIAVLNGLGYHQNNRGWKVLYPNGSKFMDVLSNDGLVFEIRQREKKDDKWQSSILFENKEARPVGYKGLTVSCNSCHSKAGTGGYATGLVPGGDGVLSVGFKALEVK